MSSVDEPAYTVGDLRRLFAGLPDEAEVRVLLVTGEQEPYVSTWLTLHDPYVHAQEGPAGSQRRVRHRVILNGEVAVEGS